MSDSFADLWNSTPTSNSKVTLGSLSSSNGSARPNQQSTIRQNNTNDIFAQLSRSSTPASIQKPTTSSRNGPLRPSNNEQTASSTTSDAFEGLFGSNGLSKTSAKMTMAERAAHVESQRREKLVQERTAMKKQNSAWDGLDLLGGSSQSQSQPPKPSQSNVLDDWGLSDEFTSQKSKPSGSSSTAAAANDTWGLDDLSSATSSASGIASPSTTSRTTAPTKKPPPRSQASIWDLDDFAGDHPTSQCDREATDSLLGSSDTNDMDDILGDLGKPIQETSQPQSRPSGSPATSPPRNPASRSSSPPPHILGQLIEMGFSIPQAKAALAATDTGEDVQAALEFLISNGAPDSRNQSPRPTSEESRPSRRPPIRERTSSQRGQVSSPPPASERPTPMNLAEQKEKLINQASTFGMNIFNKVNVAWKDVQKAAGEMQKVYEERTGGSDKDKTQRSDSRPKWWKDDQEDEDKEYSTREAGSSRLEQESQSRSDSYRDTESKAPHNPLRPEKKPPKPEPEVDLFSSPVPPTQPTPESSSGTAFYTSPYRRGKTRPAAAAVSAAVTSSKSHPTTLVLASVSALQTSSAHQTKAASFLDLGDFPAAEAEFTKAIDSLPSGQALLVRLFNARASVRSKVGNTGGVIEDAGRVIELVGSSTETVRGGVQGGDESRLSGINLSVNLGEAIVQAWKSRAEAYEGREKWQEAEKDWDKVAGAHWAGAFVKRPAPPRKVATPAPSNSEALQNLREANLAAEKEDAEKYSLKDSVDSKLIAWKGGKETNIRALLASLDMVLWPELGVPKWGMHELISEGHVKIKYMKAIAKVHPDKLSSGTFTVEQKMLAQGVFGALNEAWNAFKS